jgi:hypothetical protein
MKTHLKHVEGIVACSRCRPLPQKKPGGRRSFSGRSDLLRPVISLSRVFTATRLAWKASTFYPTQAQAENLGSQYAKLGLGEQTLTSGRIGTDLLNRFGEPISPAGEGPAFFLRNEYLPYINDVTIEGPVP